MDNREYKKHVMMIHYRALMMSVDGLQESIKDDWTDPKWPPMLWDAMNKALEKKMGKRAYAKWFDNLPVKVEG